MHRFRLLPFVPLAVLCLLFTVPLNAQAQADAKPSKPKAEEAEKTAPEKKAAAKKRARDRSKKAANPNFAPIDGATRHVYKTVGDVQLALHVFAPEGHAATDKRPGIVFFFGGGWNGGTVNQFVPHSKHLAKHGMLGIVADYRVKSRHATPPTTCVADGKSAVRWLRANAATLGLDPDRLAAGGGSAGGHVAAATATVAKFDEPGEDTTVSAVPNALCLFNPVYDNGPEDGYGHARVKDVWKDISPAHNITAQTPPTIVFLGDRDKLIPVATAQRFQAAMKAHSIRSDLHIYKGEAHGFFNRGASLADTTAKMTAFLRDLGYTSP